MADMVLSPSPSPPPSAINPPIQEGHPGVQRELSSSSVSISRPPTGASSRSGDAMEQGEGQPPSPSSTSQSDVEPDAADGFAADLDTRTNFSMAQRRATLKSDPSKGGQLVSGAGSSSPSWEQQVNADSNSPANLPHEILLHIFKFLLTRTTGHAYLRNCLLVCRSWCLCGVELLWHRPAFLHLSSLFKLINVIRRPDPTFAYVTFIRRLNFTGIASQLDNQLFAFMADCSRLERLAIGDCVKLSDEAVASVLGRLKNLVSVDLTNLKNITDLTLMELAANCKRLQGINLTNCKEITSAGVAALGRSCPLLRRVKLCGCELVGDDGILPLIANCPMLLEIDVYSCPLVSDRSVRHIWLSSSHVRELRLANCGPLTDIAFPAPARLLTSSTSALDLGPSPRQPHVRNLAGPNGSESAPTSRGASPVDRQHLAPGTHPDVAAGGDGLGVRHVQSSAASLTTPLRPLRAFEHLRVLDLTACSTVSDDAIEGIISCASRIRNLILSKCTRLTDETVFSISKLRKNLQYLHLGHVSNITDRSICHLVNSCTRLRYFDLACCSQLTDLSVTELAAKLPKLKRIGLVRVTRITDASLYALVERHLTLQRIHLSYCDNISVAAVFWLLERLPKVTHISLTGVTAFRKPELQAMCRPPPEEFSTHQRETFCVYSGQGVVDLQQYLRKVFSSEESAAQFGGVTPEVLRAIQLVKENNERSRYDRRLHYSRHTGGEAASSGRSAVGPQRVNAVDGRAHVTSDTRSPSDHPLASIAGAMHRSAGTSMHPGDHSESQDVPTPARSTYLDGFGRVPEPWRSHQAAAQSGEGWPSIFAGGPADMISQAQSQAEAQAQVGRAQIGDHLTWEGSRMHVPALLDRSTPQLPSSSRALTDPQTLMAAQVWYNSGRSADTRPIVSSSSSNSSSRWPDAARPAWLLSTDTMPSGASARNWRSRSPYSSELGRIDRPVSNVRRASGAGSDQARNLHLHQPAYGAGSSVSSGASHQEPVQVRGTTSFTAHLEGDELPSWAQGGSAASVQPPVSSAYSPGMIQAYGFAPGRPRGRGSRGRYDHRQHREWTGEITPQASGSSRLWPGQLLHAVDVSSMDDEEWDHDEEKGDDNGGDDDEVMAR